MLFAVLTQERTKINYAFVLRIIHHMLHTHTRCVWRYVKCTLTVNMKQIGIFEVYKFFKTFFFK